MGDQVRTAAPVPTAAFDFASQLPFRGCCDDHLNPPYLPPYSPELNPDEGINGDIKRSVTAKPPARSRAELKRNLICHMRKLSRLPKRMHSFFQHKTFRYAA